MSAVVEVEGKNHVAGCADGFVGFFLTLFGFGESSTGPQRGKEDGLVGLAAGMGLDVGVVATEEGCGSVDGELFDGVHVFAATVVAAAGIAFGVLVGEDGSGGLEDGGADVVFRGDKLDGVSLAGLFGAETFPDFRILLGDGVVMRMLHGCVLWQGAGPIVSSISYILLYIGAWDYATGGRLWVHD